jgi:DNA-binding NtrC family response regulator
MFMEAPIGYGEWRAQSCCTGGTRLMPNVFMRIMSRNTENDGHRQVPPGLKTKPGQCGKSVASTVLAITADLDFLSRLLEASGTSDWTVRHALSFDDAVVILSREPFPVIVYDSDLLEVPWKLALPRLAATAGGACILLASRVADEYLWQEVVRCRGYDILAKSAGMDRMVTTLRFAWFWQRKARHTDECQGSRTAGG